MRRSLRAERPTSVFLAWARAAVVVALGAAAWGCSKSEEDAGAAAVLTEPPRRVEDNESSGSKAMSDAPGERQEGAAESQPRTSTESGGGKLVLTDEEWKQRLTAEQYRVLRRQGTERAFTGKYHDSKAQGIYVCAGCGNSLFSSETKYDSGTGWPSFWQPVSEESVDWREDRGFLGVRTEVVCKRCDGHLGHVFSDGPPPSGQRYCMNSAALELDKAEP